MRISDWSSDVCSSDLAYVKHLNDQGVTIVLTTHYLEEAEGLCDRIAIINHGRLIANKPTRELVNMAQDKVVEVTDDRDLDEAPMHGCFKKIELRSDTSRVGKEWFSKCRYLVAN